MNTDIKVEKISEDLMRVGGVIQPREHKYKEALKAKQRVQSMNTVELRRHVMALRNRVNQLEEKVAALESLTIGLGGIR